MDVVFAVVAVALSYVVGMLPSAIVVARTKGVDITSFGSGNPGASNVARALGAKWGVLVFVLDAAKGAVPVALMLSNRPLAYVCGAAAIVGHIFPVTRGFRGGKGIATGGGVLLALHPPILAGALVGWLVIMKLSRKASVASIIIVPVVIALVILSGTPGWEIGGFIAIALLIEIRHISNIKRLFSGTEPPVSGTAK